MKKSKKPKQRLKGFVRDKDGKPIEIEVEVGKRPSWRDRVLNELKSGFKWTYHDFLTPRGVGFILFAFALMAVGADSDNWREYVVGGIFLCALMALKSAVEWLREPKDAQKS
jgi:hypothetical protein